MTTDTRVELFQDAGVLGQRELAEATTLATDQFISWYENGPPTRSPSTVRVEWRTPDTARHGEVDATVDEQESGGTGRGFTRSIPIRQLLDPVARGIWATRLWRYLLQARSAENIERMEQLLQELEQDDSNG